jgi:hypothetical protein
MRLRLVTTVCLMLAACSIMLAGTGSFDAGSGVRLLSTPPIPLGYWLGNATVEQRQERFHRV